MSVTAYEGVVERGHIRLDKDVRLAGKTRVVVVVSDAPSAIPSDHLRSPRLADPQQASDFALKVLDLNS
jgi:hypothetical protein